MGGRERRGLRRKGKVRGDKGKGGGCYGVRIEGAIHYLATGGKKVFRADC